MNWHIVEKCAVKNNGSHALQAKKEKMLFKEKYGKHAPVPAFFDMLQTSTSEWEYIYKEQCGLSVLTVNILSLYYISWNTGQKRLRNNSISFLFTF